MPGAGAGDIALDVENGRLYWVGGYVTPDGDQLASGVWSANLDGTNAEIVLAVPASDLVFLADEFALDTREVPEPSSVLLCIIALGVVGWWQKHAA